MSWLSALTLLGSIAAGQVQDEDPAVLAMLGDRVAGAPLSCISSRFLKSSKIIAGKAIVYEGPGSRLYLQKPRQGADFLNDGDVVVSNSPIDSLCRGDYADLLDRSTRIRTGFVTFDVFTPYIRISNNGR